MNRGYCLILFLPICLLSGCLLGNSFPVAVDRTVATEADTSQLNNEFNLTAPADECLSELQLDHDLIVQEILSTKVGSLVSIAVDPEHPYMGTVLGADRNNVELMNCVCREVVDGPKGRQCRTSHLPFQSFKTPHVIRFAVISGPSIGFSLPNPHVDSGGVSISEIVYKNGKRQRWGMPPE